MPFKIIWETIQGNNIQDQGTRGRRRPIKPSNVVVGKDMVDCGMIEYGFK